MIQIFFVHSVFYLLKSKKKIQSDPKILKNIFFKIYVTFFEKLSDHSETFFTVQYIEIWMDKKHFGSLLLKVPFFRMWDSFFKSPNLPKILFQRTILSLKFVIPAHIGKLLTQIYFKLAFLRGTFISNIFQIIIWNFELFSGVQRS